MHIAAAQVNFATREIDLSIIDQQLRKNFISIKILWAEDYLWLKIQDNFGQTFFNMQNW